MSIMTNNGFPYFCKRRASTSLTLLAVFWSVSAASKNRNSKRREFKNDRAICSCKSGQHTESVSWVAVWIINVVEVVNRSLE